MPLSVQFCSEVSDSLLALPGNEKCKTHRCENAFSIS